MRGRRVEEGGMVSFIHIPCTKPVSTKYILHICTHPFPYSSFISLSCTIYKVDKNYRFCVHREPCKPTLIYTMYPATKVQHMWL